MDTYLILFFIFPGKCTTALGGNDVGTNKRMPHLTMDSSDCVC